MPQGRIAALYRELTPVSTPGPNHTGSFNLQESSKTTRNTVSTDGKLQLDRAVVLVGMMGSGKTSVGRRLARALGWPFQDADWAIEHAAGTSIANIFAEIGEEAFRQSERQVIARLLNEQAHQVLALGGGSFVAPETRHLIQEKAISIWLDADIEILVQRTSRRDDRPLLKAGDPRVILSGLLDERRPIYAEADIVVDSSSGALGDVVDRALAGLQAFAASGATS